MKRQGHESNLNKKNNNYYNNINRTIIISSLLVKAAAAISVALRSSAMAFKRLVALVTKTSTAPGHNSGLPKKL